MKKQQLKILLINLKKRKDKITKFKQMNPYLDFKIIEAIDATNLNKNYKKIADDLSLPEEVCKLEWFLIKNNFNFECFPTPKFFFDKIGAVLSHYKALLYAEANAIYPLLILEDEVKLIRTTIPDPPEDCFMFYLGGTVKNINTYKIGWEKIKNSEGDRVYGAYSYGFPTLEAIRHTLRIIKSGFFCETSYNIFKHEWNSFYKRDLQPLEKFYINNIQKYGKTYIYTPILALKNNTKIIKNLQPIRYINIINPDIFLAYVSIIYYILENDVPKLYFESKFKRKYNPLKHKSAFQSVGNRIGLSEDGKTRLNCIHLGKKRSFGGDYSSCVGNERYSELFEILQELHTECFPNFEYNQILINKNNIFKKHKDSKNIKSQTLLFSLGDYSGDLHIEGTKIDTCLTPIIFDGKTLTHAVPKIKGIRYSILFYTI